MKPVTYDWNGWELTDVNNFVSDTVLAIVCFACAFLLVKLLPERLDHRFWRGFFLLLGISAFLGGVGHLFRNYDYGFYGLMASWTCNLIAIAFLERAVVEQLRNEQVRKWLIIGIYLKLVGMIVWLFIKQDYLVAAISSGIGTIGMLLPVVVFIIRRKTEVSVNWYIAGFVLSVIAGLAFGLKWDIHKWLQHADVGHYLIGLSVICFYRGVKWLHQEDKLYPAREEIWW